MRSFKKLASRSLFALAALVLASCSEQPMAPDGDSGAVFGIGDIGNFVWHDLNANGVQDVGEPGIPGVTLTLVGSEETLTTTTDANGMYLFSFLGADTYTVTVTPPPGYTASPTGAGTPATDSNTNPATVVLTDEEYEDLTIDFGYYIYVAPTGTIGDFVWSDTNGNGTQDLGEPGIAGRLVTLSGPGGPQTTTTDANGGYLFTGLSAGCYTVSTGTPAGTVPSPSGVGAGNTDSNGSPASVCLLTSSSVDLTIDFGFVPNAGRIGDFVWSDTNGDGDQDVGEPGIAGVTVTLSGPGGPQSTITDANGGYLFTGLGAGCYTVTVATPANTVPSPSNVGSPALDSNGSPAAVCLPTGTSEDLTIDFGFVPELGQIGNFVWHDADADGLQSIGEPGLAGVIVTLAGPGGPQSTTTDANGAYLFTGLAAGCYTVTAATPVGYVPTMPLGGNVALDSNGSPAAVCLPTNVSVDHTIDFGYVTVESQFDGGIGDFVWYDLDGDGIQDGGESGIPGLTVTLTGPGGTQTQTTNASGAYYFGDLGAGCYTVTVGTPAGYMPSPNGAGGNAALDSNGSPAAVCLPDNNSSDLTIDFGFVLITNPAIKLVKKTNGTDNNTAPGVQVPVGSVVTWTYAVTNTGDVVLAPVTITDDIVGAICTIPSLGVGATHTCTKTGIATAGQYTNMGTAIGTAPNGTTVNSQDPDNYFGTLQGLRASKTAAGTYDRNISWTLTKTVNPTSHIGTAGSTAGSSTWTVVATKSAVEGNNRVTGQIVVSNPNVIPATFAVTDQLSDGTNATVSCPTNTVAGNGSVTCTYTASPATRNATSNTATVTSSVGGATATAPVGFTANVTGSETAVLADPRFTFTQTVSSSTTRTFQESFPCSSNAALYTNNNSYTRTETNTATLTFGATTLTRNATVSITCHRAWGDETATGAGIRWPGTNNWFMYSPFSTAKINLIAGQHYDAGDIFMTRTATATTIRIVLHAGYRWSGADENLKVHPMVNAPTSYIQPGAFQYKFDASGSSFTVTIPGTSHRFYGIHGDVERLLP